MFESMMKKLKKEFGFLSENETEDSSGIEDNVLKQLDRSEKLDDIDTVTFGLETDDGKIVKVYVQADQAEEFEKALSAKLGEVDDIEECLNELSKEFQIVDVEWPDDKEDEEEDVEDGEDNAPQTDGSEVMNKQVYGNKSEKNSKGYTAKLEDLNLGERIAFSLTEGADGGSVEDRLSTATQLLVYHALLELGLPEIALNKSPYKASIVQGIKHRAAEMTKDTALKAALKVFVSKATHSKSDPDATEEEPKDDEKDEETPKEEPTKDKDDEPKKKHHKKKKKEPDEEPPEESVEEPEEAPSDEDEAPKDDTPDEPVEKPKKDDDEEEEGKKKVIVKKKPKFMESLMTINEGLYHDFWDGVNQLLTYVSATPELLQQLQGTSQYKALVNRSQSGISMNVKSGVRMKLIKLTNALKKVNPQDTQMEEGITPENLTSLIEDLFNMADPTPNKSLATALLGSSVYKTFINRAKPRLSLKFNGSMHQMLVQLMDVVGETMALQKPNNNEQKPAAVDSAPTNVKEGTAVTSSTVVLTEVQEWTYTMEDDNAVISYDQFKFSLDPESLEKAVKALEGHTVIVLKDATDPKLKITISTRGINAIVKKAGDDTTYPMSAKQIKEFSEFALNGAEGKEDPDAEKDPKKKDKDVAPKKDKKPSEEE